MTFSTNTDANTAPGPATLETKTANPSEAKAAAIENAQLFAAEQEQRRTDHGQDDGDFRNVQKRPPAHQ
jgi:hypothetical protein